MKKTIKQNAQAIIWECERQERLNETLKKLNQTKGFQRIKIEGYGTNDACLYLEDLDETAQTNIFTNIREQVKNCLN